MKKSRRNFLQQTALATAAMATSKIAFTASSYNKIIGANERVRVGVVGFSDRHRATHMPCFMNHYKELNFDLVAVSDIWKKRREEGAAAWKEKMGHDVIACRNNEEMYDKKLVDAVFVSTADFQHAIHATEAVKAGCDVYCEKPFAETMEDNRNALKAIKATDRIVQIGSQRRSGNNYIAAANFIQSGKFGGGIKMVELTWNVNQPGRWRRPGVVPLLKEEDTDWKRFLLNRPHENFDARKYLEFRLFWPYSSGLPGQWMSHQIDTVHWFSQVQHPTSVVANGGIYMWKDGRKNWDNITAVFEYDDKKNDNQFQVTFQSRMFNGDENPSEIYYSNGGELNLITNKISPKGGLREREAAAMNMKPNLLTEMSLAEPDKIIASANTGGDKLTSNHVRNWMECVRSRQQPHAPVEAGYSHSIATIMTNAAVHTGSKATFDEKTQEVMVNGKVFKY